MDDVRFNALQMAIHVHEGHGFTQKIDSILALAKQFEAYIRGTSK
jgi:hypothetical protein